MYYDTNKLKILNSTTYGIVLNSRGYGIKQYIRKKKQKYGKN